MVPLVVFLLALVTPELTLATSPRHVYKENDGRDGRGKTETFVFRLVVRDSKGLAAEPTRSRIELRAGRRVVKSLELWREALSGIREKPGTLSADTDALYALKFAFTEPIDEKIDLVVVRLEAGGASAYLDVPVAEY